MIVFFLSLITIIILNTGIGFKSAQPPIDEIQKEVGQELDFPTQPKEADAVALVVADDLVEIVEIEESIEEPEESKEMDLSNPRYLPYFNERYGFSIEYPDILNNVYLHNLSGGTFVNDQGDVELSVHGGNNTFGDTAKSQYNQMIEETEIILYKVQRDNWYVFSWLEGDRMFYRKEVIGEGSCNGFEISYPAKDEKLYDAIVEKLYATFKSPNVDQSW